jgi:hypothetical protein
MVQGKALKNGLTRSLSSTILTVLWERHYGPVWGEGLIAIGPTILLMTQDALWEPTILMKIKQLVLLLGFVVDGKQLT